MLAHYVRYMLMLGHTDSSKLDRCDTRYRMFHVKRSPICRFLYFIFMYPTKRIRKLLIIALILILAFSLFLFLSYRIQCTEYSLETGKLQQPIKIALITDLHSCKYGENSQPLLDIIHKEQPNIVLLGGDIYDDDLPIEVAANFIGNLAKKYPSYYVSGNHEYWSEMMDVMKSLTKERGATVLDGQCVLFEKTKDTINICGIDDPTYIGLDSLKKQLESAKQGMASGKTNLLLAHRPELLNLYAEYGFDIVAAGHAHGGQWRLPFVLENGFYGPDQGYFPKYTTGIHKQKNTTMIISRGLAKESTRLPRIFNRPEIVFITIR